MRILVALSMASMAVACTTPAMETPQDPPKVMGDGVCDASGLQGHIGHKATAESGAILLNESGAAKLRWIPPDSAVTMDYRKDRLNVSYDREMTITKISCG